MSDNCICDEDRRCSGVLSSERIHAHNPGRAKRRERNPQ